MEATGDPDPIPLVIPLGSDPPQMYTTLYQLYQCAININMINTWLNVHP